ncbi:hypothetical protein SGRIM128S_07251 [Streptomyces griseomycini]
MFCVSESGGATIDPVTLSHTGNNAILIENCSNVTLAAQSGTVTGGGEIRLAARSEFPNNRDITVQNLTVTDSSIPAQSCRREHDVPQQPPGEQQPVGLLARHATGAAR